MCGSGAGRVRAGLRPDSPRITPDHPGSPPITPGSAPPRPGSVPPRPGSDLARQLPGAAGEPPGGLVAQLGDLLHREPPQVQRLGADHGLGPWRRDGTVLDIEMPAVRRVAPDLVPVEGERAVQQD